MNDDFQEYKLCKGKDVVKETYENKFHIISLGEEKGCQLILGVLSDFKERMAYFKQNPFKSRSLS
jgi:hypothetical protein